MKSQSFKPESREPPYQAYRSNVQDIEIQHTGHRDATHQVYRSSTTDI